MNWGCWYLHAINCHQLAFFIQHEGAWGRTGSTVHRIKVWVAGIIHDTLGPHLVHKILKFCWTQHFPLVVLSFSDGFPMLFPCFERPACEVLSSVPTPTSPRRCSPSCAASRSWRPPGRATGTRRSRPTAARHNSWSRTSRSWDRDRIEHRKLMGTTLGTWEIGKSSS